MVPIQHSFSPPVILIAGPTASGKSALALELAAALDPVAASRLPPGDRQRLMRAWEVVQATGRPIGQWQAGTGVALPYRFASILLAPPREAIYAACNTRFVGMIAAGGLDEATT